VLEEWDDLNITDVCIFVLCPSFGDIVMSHVLLPTDCKMGLPGFVHIRLCQRESSGEERKK
jgi:hypothetical protein